MTEMKLNIFGWHDSKISKGNRCKPAVSNGTILATMQEFIMTEVALVLSITDILILLD